MSDFAPETCHQPLLHAPPRTLGFRPEIDLAAWREDLDAAVRKLLGVTPVPAELDIRVESKANSEDFHETRFVFTAEANADVPCHLLVPKGVGDKPPLMICLQGHSTGMHISLGRAKYDGDDASISGGDRDFAVRAVKEGFAALVMEQRCFGERIDRRESPNRVPSRCTHATMAALLLGRTMIGERVFDVSRAIDAVESGFADQVDTARVACMGNSGGGTITWWASCVERRIKAAMPSCAVCTLADSIGSIDHCPDNYLPGVLQYIEMGDAAGLIAPRPLVVVTGQEDDIFPIDGVRKNFETIRAIYGAAEAQGRCELVVGEGGHRFYADQAWPVFHRLTGW